MHTRVHRHGPVVVEGWTGPVARAYTRRAWLHLPVTDSQYCSNVQQATCLAALAEFPPAAAGGPLAACAQAMLLEQWWELWTQGALAFRNRRKLL